MSEFFAMGGYAAFIWPAYLIAAVVLVGILAQSLLVLRQRERLLETLREELRGGAAEDNE